MNRIYKVIWSKVKHQYVVVSEFAHSCTKSTSKRASRSAAAVLVVLALTTGVGIVPIWAANDMTTVEELPSITSSEKDKNTEAPSIMPLAAVKLTGQKDDNDNFIIYGDTPPQLNDSDDPSSSGGGITTNTIIIGDRNTIGDVVGTNIEWGASPDSILLGNDIQVYGRGTKYDEVKGQNIALGNNVILGTPAEEGEIYANVIQGRVSGSIAIGNNSQVEASQSVALGVGALIETQGNSSIAIGYKSHSTGGSGGSDVVIGAEAETKGSAVAIGNKANAGRGSVAIGSTSTSPGDYTPATAARYSVAVGHGSSTMGDWSVAMGNTATTGHGTYSVVIGDESKVIDTAQQRRYRASILGAQSTTESNDSVIVGYDSHVYKSADKSVAIGAGAYIDSGAAESTAIGANARVSQDDILTNSNYTPEIEADWNAKADTRGVLSVGSTEKYTDDNGNEVQPFSRRIINVANGRIEEGSHDAVNGGQLRNYAFTSDNMTWVDNDKDGIEETLRATWKDQYGIGKEFTTDFTGVASQEWVNNQISKNGGGSWNVTTSGNLGDDESTPINKNNTVDFSGVKYDDTNSNIIVSQETQTDDTQNITGTNLTFDLSDKVILGNAPQEGEADKRVTLDGIEGNVSIGTGVSLKYDGTAAIGAIRFNRDTPYTPSGEGQTEQHSSTITGLSNTYWDANDQNIGGGRAATEEQLNQAIDYAMQNSNSSWQVSGGNNQAALVDKTHNTVHFDGDTDDNGHQNITVAQTENAGKNGYDLTFKLNDNVILGSGDNQITLDATESKGSIAIGDKVFMNANGSASFGDIKLNSEGQANPEHVSTIAGLTNKTWNQNGTYNAGRAATEEQLQAAIGGVQTSIEASAYKSWNVTTNGNTKDSKTISSGNTVDFAGKTDGTGHSNVVVSKEDTKDGTNLKFDLDDKVILGEDAGKQIVLDGTTGNVSIGNVSVDNGTGISFMADGSATFGKIQINKENGSTIIGLTNTEWDPNGTYNAGRAATEEQLHQAISSVETNFQQNDQHLVANPGTQDGHYFVDGKNQVNLQVQNGIDENNKPKYDTVTIDNVAQASDVGNVNDFHDDVKNEDGSHTTVVDAINNIDTRVDQVEIDIDNLGDRIDGVEATAGQHSSVSNTDGNITVDGTGKNEAGGVDYVVGLNNDKITVGNETNNVTIEGTKGSITVTNSVSAGQTTISNEGVSVGDNTYITDKGINANNQVITNVAAGSADTDAVNVSQLKGVEQRVENNSMAITNIGNKVDKLDNRIDEVGAGAAALAALHPLDFDPDDKWDFAAGYGNYRGENAVAIGAFYRPNEDTMFSVGGTVGNGDNMVNAGVSFKLGQGNNVSTSRVAMAKEIKSMRDIVAKQDAQIQKLTAMVNALVGMEAIAPDTTTMFPDVPENHWAYEAVETMAKTGLVKGYPDGEFKGDRNMTRYEFAQIVYNAIQAGIKVDERLVQEFRPELEYFRIDTISKDRDGNPVIQRVRANEIPATK